MSSGEKNKKERDSFDDILSSYYTKLSEINDQPHFSSFDDSESISEKIDEGEREQKLKNDGLEQDNKLKKYTLFILFAFLGVETLAIFSIAFFQGFMFKSFYIEEWSFRVLVVSTIMQITAMLTIAVRHLFPSKR